MGVAQVHAYIVTMYEDGDVREEEIPVSMIGLRYGSEHDERGYSVASDIYKVCPACGYIEYDMPRDSDNGHDCLCCRSATGCAWLNKPNEVCQTHDTDTYTTGSLTLSSKGEWVEFDI